MSKYIKLEDLKWHSPETSITEPLTEFYITESDIADLPTIEVMEYPQVEGITPTLVTPEVSEDCISRVTALDIAVAYVGAEMVDRMLTAPSVVPSRVEGEWVRNFDGNEWYWYCTNCKTQWYEDDLWMGGNEFPNYCPNCGAKMRG